MRAQARARACLRSSSMRMRPPTDAIVGVKSAPASRPVDAGASAATAAVYVGARPTPAMGGAMAERPPHAPLLPLPLRA